MSESEESIEQRLARIAQATSQLQPSQGFEARVMQALAAEATPGWLVSASRASRRAVVAAVLMAAACASLAVQDERSADEASAVAYTALEVDW